MKALAWLLATTIKNRLKQLIHKPAQLVLVLVFVLVFVTGLLSPGASPEENPVFRPMAELRSIVLALYAVIFILTSFNGLSSGASFYSMADVNVLFSSPISQQKILFYGLLRQLGTSFLVGFFLLFQFYWLHSTYNLTFGGLLAILLGYCLMIFCGQLTSMVIYSFTSGSESRQRTVKAMLLILVGALIASVAIPALRATGAASLRQFYPDARLAAAVNAADSWLPALFPVAGWLKTAVSGLFDGAILPFALGLGASAAYVGGLVMVITRMNPDFYEDVLKATEVSFTAITAAKQGTMKEAIPANVKVGKTGLGAGAGSSTFYYKHRLERRRSRIFLIDTMTLVWAAICIVFAIFMHGEGILPVFAFATYMQMFSTGAGRWLRELTKPYVYMIPASPFRKLIGVCRESILQAALEAIVVMVPVGLIVGASPLDTAACVIARFSFSLLFMAGYIAVERLFGQMVSKTLIMFVLIVAMALIAAPGIVVGVLLGISVNLLAAMFAMTTWNIAAASLIAFLCRNILNYAELNNR